MLNSAFEYKRKNNISKNTNIVDLKRRVKLEESKEKKNILFVAAATGFVLAITGIVVAL